MWKIEEADAQRGGLMTWDGNYRLKHITSGKYLRGVVVGKKEIEGKILQKFKIELSFEIDDHSLFQFRPIQNLINEEPTKKYITSDAYFRICHIMTKAWLIFK